MGRYHRGVRLGRAGVSGSVALLAVGVLAGCADSPVDASPVPAVHAPVGPAITPPASAQLTGRISPDGDTAGPADDDGDDPSDG